MFVAAQALSGGTSHAKSVLDAHAHDMVLDGEDDMEDLDLESRLADQQMDHFRKELNRLCASYAGKGQREERTSYTFNFIAGDVHRKHQALNLTVHVRIFGSLGHTDEFTFRPATSSTVLDSLDVQIDDLPQVGTVLAVALGHGDSGAQKTLFLDHFTITNNGTGDVWDVPCFSWFSRVRGDHNLYRICWAFPQGTREEPRMRLTINDVRHEEDFTLYSIVIESGHCKWRVWKRYSELCDLHERLKKLFPDKERSAVFPRKHLRKHDSSVIEGRVTAFKEWLRLVVHNETLLKVPEVRGTLQIRPPSVRHGDVSIGNKRASSHQKVVKHHSSAKKSGKDRDENASHAADKSDGEENDDSSEGAGQAMESVPLTELVSVEQRKATESKEEDGSVCVEEQTLGPGSLESDGASNTESASAADVSAQEE